MNTAKLAAAAVFAATISMGASNALADNTVIQQDRTFRPGDITIPAGSSLTIKNQDEFIHQVYVDSPGFNYDSEEKQPGEDLHIAFPTAGTFPVRCHIHPKMLLTVHVK